MREQQTYDRSLDEPADVRPPVDLPDEPYYRQPPPPPAATPRGRARLGALLLLAGLLWLVFELAWGRAGVGSSTVLDRVFDGASRIELDAGSADVQVRTWDGEGIRVAAVQRGGDRDDYQIDVQESGGGLHVTTQSSPRLGFLFFGHSLHYTVQVPADGQVTVHTSSGDIELDGVSGADSSRAPELASTSGDVRVQDLRHGLTVETGSGDVRLSDVAGPLHLKSTSGDIQLRDGAATSADVETTSGEIDLRGVAGALNLHSTSGDIDIRDARDGLLTISTSSASVTYEGSLADGNHSVAAVSGDVTLRLPDDSSFTLQASTVSGDLSLDSFERQSVQSGRRELNATVGAGRSRLTIETTSGDVEVRGT